MIKKFLISADAKKLFKNFKMLNGVSLNTLRSVFDEKSSFSPPHSEGLVHLKSFLQGFTYILISDVNLYIIQVLEDQKSSFFSYFSLLVIQKLLDL